MITDNFLLERLKYILDNSLFDLDGFKIPKSTVKISKNKVSKVDIQVW